MKLPKVGILGAGPSGLLAALFLDKAKFDYDILESSDHVGGVASSVFDRGFTFDYGPHIMFSKYQDILKFMIDSLGENVHKCRRNNKVCYQGTVMKYPFENDLKALPLQDRYECLMGYIQNPYREQFEKPENLQQWLLKVFGKGICEKYLFPYNEKVWNIPVEKLSMYWADRIPCPPVEDVVKSALGFETEGYLHQLYYHYPRTGGYQAISEAWAKKVKPVLFHRRVDHVRRADSGFEVRCGEEIRKYDFLISTLPVHLLRKMVNFEVPEALNLDTEALIVNPLYLINFGVKGVDQNRFTAVYFPDREFWVNRLSFPTTFSPGNAPEGHYSLQAEITCTAESEMWKRSDEEILEHTKQGLLARGFLPKNSADIVYESVVRVPRAYVVYDVGFEEKAERVRDWYGQHGIHLLGRFSYFEYINVDMAVFRAMKVLEKINGAPVALPLT